MRPHEQRWPVHPGPATSILAAGERRSTTANTIYRDPAWRKGDADGALRMHPNDAARLGIEADDHVRVTTKVGRVEVPVALTDTMPPGMISLPNGLGVDYPDDNGVRVQRGASPNELTSSTDRDWLAGTPWHKHVRARVERLGPSPTGVEAGADPRPVEVPA